MWRLLFLTPFYLLASSLPLLSEVGRNLEYEYATLAGIFSVLLIPLSALLIPKNKIADKSKNGQNFPAIEMIWITLLAPLISALPPAILFLANQCPCSKMGFLFWQSVQWLPAIFIGHAFYHLLLRFRLNNTPNWKLWLGYVLVIVLLSLHMLLQLWTNPQVRLTHLLFGFLHGPIYDSLIQFDFGILFARMSHVLLSLLLLAIVWYAPKARWYLVTGIIALLYTITAFISANFPSQMLGQDKLNRLLPHQLAAPDFTLHYLNTHHGETLVTPKAIKRIFRDTDFHLNELKKNLELTEPPHIHVFVYPSQKEKKLWFGGGATDVTDVYGPSIHITEQEWPHSTLRHELTHAILANNGYYGIGFHPNMAFTEGIASALAPSGRTLTPHMYAAWLLDVKKIGKIQDLFSPMFWRYSGARAYIVAESFIDFIIEKYGVKAAKNLYSGDQWQKALGESEETTVRGWREKIFAGYKKEDVSIYTDAKFRKEGVLDDLCPHTKADYQRHRNEGLFIRLRQPLSWEPDSDFLHWRRNIEPGNKGILLKIWQKEIHTVATERFPEKSRIATWIHALKGARNWPAKSIEDIEMAVLESDLLRLNNEWEKSYQILETLYDYTQRIHVGDSLLRRIHARFYIENVLSSEKSFNWRVYLAGWNSRIPLEVFDDQLPWIQNYLLLRNLPKKFFSAAYLNRLANIEVPKDVHLNFKMEWYRILGTKFFMKEMYKEAELTFNHAHQIAPDGWKALLSQHTRHAAFYKQFKKIQSSQWRAKADSQPENR